MASHDGTQLHQHSDPSMVLRTKTGYWIRLPVFHQDVEDSESSDVLNWEEKT